MAYKLSASEMDQIDRETAQTAHPLQQFNPQAMNIPQEPAEKKNFLSELMRGLTRGGKEDIRGLENVGQRLNLSSGMGNAPTIKMPTGETITNPFYRGTSPITREQFGIPESTTTGAKIGEFAGSIAPTLALPEMRMLNAPRFIESAVSKSNPAIKAAAHTLGIAGKNALAMAGLNPFLSPDQPIGKSMERGAITGGLLGPAARGVSNVASAIPGGISKLLRMGGTATPEEIAQRVQAFPPGTKAPLGEAIQSPMLKQIQTAVLAKMPLSGMAQTYHQIGEGIVKPVQDVATELGTHVKTNGYNDIVDHLKDLWSTVRNQNKTNYDELHTLADSTGVPLSLKEYKKEGIKQLNRLKEDKKLTPEFSQSISPTMKKISSILTKIPKLEPTAKFKSGGLKTAQINKLYREAIEDKDRYAMTYLKPLKEAIDDDYMISAVNSGSPEIYSKWQKAVSYHKSHVVPMEDKSIYAFTSGKKNPSQLGRSFIKSGKEEEPEKIQQLTSLIPDDLRKALAHQYLTKGEDINKKETLSAMMRHYNSLGPRSKSALLNPTERNTLDQSLSASRIMGAQKDQMFIPKTGEQAAIAKIVMGLLSGIIGGGAGLHVGGPMGALKGIGGTFAAGNALSRALTSPAVRNIAIKGARRTEKLAPPKETKAGGKFLPALESVINGNKQ